MSAITEAYVATALADSGLPVFALSNETECDFVAGGKKKQAKAADFVIRDNTDLPSGNVLPMWMLGLGY